MDFESSQTKLNLARSFAGECQAGARYQITAQKAQMEGKINIQNLLKNLAKQEMSHARVFWDLIAKNSKVPQKNIEINAGYPYEDGDVMQMIKFASNAEKSENTSIYPSFAKIAEDEGFNEVAEKFKLIALVEHDHFIILDELFSKMKTKSLYKSSSDREWECATCGHSHYGKEGFDVCPLCGATKDSISLDTLGK